MEAVCLGRNKALRTGSYREGTFVRQLANSFTPDSRYMTSLSVFIKTKPYLKLGAADTDLPNHPEIQSKIAAALQLLTFREQHVLVQFWCHHEDGKLRTTDQPFGFGVMDAGLSRYRQDSERNSFLVDNDHEEEDHSPAARVFRQGFPEWTPDVTNYLPKHFPQQECAIRCNLHGYLALPVFDSNTMVCVGVLELLASSEYMNYTYEVSQIHRALKTQNLTSPEEFGCPALYVLNERRQSCLVKIHDILKTVCDIYNLPLAQTWSMSQQSSFVSHEKVIEKSCSSFDTRCIGKVCMSTAALPFHVQHLDVWHFREACKARHLDRSRSFVGKALLSRGSCFCADVTKLSEEEYPLVHHARIYRLIRCFAIFLHSVEANDDFVLEFFLPLNMTDNGDVLNLVQTLKQKIEIASGFELGDSSCREVVGLPMDLPVNLKPDVIETSWDCVADNFTSSDSGSSMVSLPSPTDFTSTDFGEECKKRKIESVAEMVTAEISCNGDKKFFRFSISLGLSHLENEVSQSFMLKGKKLRLKYVDEDGDLILIGCDDDLKSVPGINNIINLTCLSN